MMWFRWWRVKLVRRCAEEPLDAEEVEVDQVRPGLTRGSRFWSCVCVVGVDGWEFELRGAAPRSRWMPRINGCRLCWADA